MTDAQIEQHGKKLKRVKKDGRTREQRINRIAKYKAAKFKGSEEGKKARRPLLQRAKKYKDRTYIAYDLETTRIGNGTPQVKYITAFGVGFRFKERIDTLEQLAIYLKSCFLTEANNGKRFVAWNGNAYDAFFVARALLSCERFVLRPYLTANKALRGMKVTCKETNYSWEFLDGISMVLGTAKRPLKDFLKVFAPDYQKLDAPDWETEEFDADNQAHVDYAMRDSEGLYHAIIRADAIVLEHFGQGLQPTIGNLGIKIFQQEMPTDIAVWSLSNDLDGIVRKRVMRGGYCFHAKKFSGPVWKYDINQAYAAAMRECLLPAGRLFRITNHAIDYRVAIYRIRATNPRNQIPFYCVDVQKQKVFLRTEIADSWITSIELRQLKSEGWLIEILEGYAWSECFSMTNMVDKLENLRVNGPGGPKSAQGEMMKAIGNNSYGKTVEVLDGLELVMALECPEGFSEYQDVFEDLPYIWFKIGTSIQREYHQPQIGAFITAHVRMVLRRAILQNPDSWIYADTDCVVFSEPVELDIDPGRYGAWKVETEGEDYRFIAKKVYYSADFTERKAKGMRLKELTQADFDQWFDGNSPTQDQLQRNNFLKFLGGADMFRTLRKRGQVHAEKI